MMNLLNLDGSSDWLGYRELMLVSCRLLRAAGWVNQFACVMAVVSYRMANARRVHGARLKGNA